MNMWVIEYRMSSDSAVEDKDCYLGSASAGFTVLPGAASSLSRGGTATEQMLPWPHLAAITRHIERFAGLAWPPLASCCGQHRESMD